MGVARVVLRRGLIKGSQVIEMGCFSMGAQVSVSAPMRRLGPIVLSVLCLSLVAVPERARAQELTGFQLEHFEPLAAQGKNRLGVASSEDISDAAREPRGPPAQGGAARRRRALGLA